jgi:hypothetical protein
MTCVPSASTVYLVVEALHACNFFFSISVSKERVQDGLPQYYLNPWAELNII